MRTWNSQRLFNHCRIGLGLAALLLSLNTFAQTPSPQTSPAPAPDLSDSNQEVFKWTNLLDKLALEARTLSEEELRSEVVNAVADAYWEASQTRSKELFSSALELALAIETEKPRQLAVSNVISAAARRDAQLARSLVKVLLESKNRSDAAIKSSLDLLDPDLKTSELIAITASSTGASADSAWLIFQMQKRDPAVADRVYLAYLNNENSRSLGRLLYLAGYAFGNGESFGGPADPLDFTGFSGFDFSAPGANRALIDAFLNRADQTVNSTPGQANSVSPQDIEVLNAQVFFAVSYLLPETEKYRPDLYVRWASLRNDIGQRIDPRHREAILQKLKNIFEQRERLRTRTAGEELSSEDVLQQAEKIASSCDRDAIYARAVFQLSFKGDFKKAIAVADKISALALRIEVLQFVYYDMSIAITKGGSANNDDALRYANRVEAPELRALLLTNLAAFVAKNRDADGAKQLVWDAIKLAERVEQPSIRAAVLIAVENQLPESDSDDRPRLLKDAVSAVNRSDEIAIDRLTVQRRVDYGCEKDKGRWYGGTIARVNLIDSILRFSQSHEADAMQLALDLERDANRIKALAAIAGSAIKRIQAATAEKRKPANL
jgi:hypothetical protein